MAVCDGSGGAVMHPGNSPERGRGRRTKQSRGSETEKAGDGTAAGGEESLQALQRSRGQYLSSGQPMTLATETLELHM